jgi:SNF2 family DNA or RNA helicase
MVGTILFAPKPRINRPVTGFRDGESGLSLSPRKGGSTGAISNPSPEEYADNELMKKAIEAGGQQFLKDPAKGFVADNIHVNNFARSSFTFVDGTEVAKGFTGKTLLRNREKEINIHGIAFLLRELGIRVTGEVEKLPKLPNPTEEEYADNELMKKAIEAGGHQFLKNPSRGFVADNIYVSNFVASSFTFIDKVGIVKGFTGWTFLRNRKKRNIHGIISLLRELGIQVTGEAEKVSKLLAPTEKEYADNQLVRKAIEARKKQFLKDPNQGFVADNIQVKNFVTASFTFADGKGIAKGFTGLTLLRNREKEINIHGIVSLLKELGIRIIGEVQRLSTPTQDEYADDQLMRKAVEEGKKNFLKDSAQGLVADNIHVANFARSSFTFKDATGATKRFTGRTLLENRTKGSSNIHEILSLLKELGISVVGQVEKLPKLPSPAGEEYADNPLMRKAVEGGKENFLKDPSRGFVADNIYVRSFAHATFTCVDGTGNAKRFIGERLLRNRGKKISIDGIVSLFRELGIEVYDTFAEEGSFTLQAAKGYHWTRGARPNKALLEGMLIEILQGPFKGRPERMTAEVIKRTTYQDPQGRPISGLRLLNHYRHAWWLEDHSDRKDIGQNKAIKERGYSAAEAIARFKRQVLEVADFQNLSYDDFESFIREKGLQEIVGLFADDPAMLAQALTFLKGKEFQNQDVTQFVKAYIGLKVKKEKIGEGAKKEDSWERRRKYIRAIVDALEKGEMADLSEETFQQQLDLLIRLARKSFEENPKELIHGLESGALEPVHPFIQRLHGEAARYFRETRAFEIRGMTTPAYGYEKEGAHFLTAHDRAILADEAGMGKSYQVIAAAESLGLRRILWVTTATNKETLREEILTHSQVKDNEIKIVISGDPKERKEQIRQLNGERYVITNYEALVALKASDPEGYAKLTNGVDVVVVDEAQLTDNPETLRTQAVREISTPRRWLLTASPYQNKPEKMWTLLNYLDPDRYPDYAAFKQMYCQSTQGLLLLHSELRGLMLRRNKKDTLTLFRPETEIPFEDQLADGIPRLPRKDRVPPERSGTYDLSEEQADLIAWMIADFNGWAKYFNENLPNGAEPIVLENINSLEKFGTIQKVIYEPEYFGITTPNPVFAALDQVMARRLKTGEKVILWCWNTSMIDALEKRYGKLGVRRIDGTVLGNARDQARHDFQEDPNVRILVANYVSGGIGLTLTAAHSAIFVQLPQQYPLLYQTEGRHQRLIGLNNLRHAKEHVEVEWMIPKFPPGFIENLENEELKEILSHGTLVEQTRARLEGGEVLYNFLMEGYGDPRELENYFKEGIIKGMGLDREVRLDYISHLTGEIRIYAEVVQDLLPLWRLVQGNPAAEERILHLIERFKEYPAFAKRIGQVFQGSSQSNQEDLDFLLSLFEIRNKFIREQIFERVPDLMANIYQQGKSLYQTAEGLKVGKLTPAAFVAQLYLRGGAGGEVVVGMTRALSQMRDTPLKRYIEEHLFVGLFGIIGNKGAEAVLKEKGPLFEGVKLEDQIHTIYRLGLLARTRADLIKDLKEKSFDSWGLFFTELERLIHQAIGEFAGRSAEQVKAMIQSNKNWRNVDHLLALIAGWQASEENVLLDQFGEELQHFLDGDFQEWRKGVNNRQHGNSIDYLSDDPQFWEEFSKSNVSRIDRLTVSIQKVKGDLLKDYIAILQEFDQEGEAVEGAWVKEQIEAYRSMGGQEAEQEREETSKQFQNERRLLGMILSKNDVSDEAKAVLEKYGLSFDGSLTSKTQIKHKLEEIWNLISWMTLDNGFRNLAQNKEVDKEILIRELESRAKFYRVRKYDKMAEHIEALKEILIQWTSDKLTFKDITIEDTDDPAILSRMGALHPEMTNCFNPNGSPVFNQFVVGALGSKNMRLVVVREGGKIIAAAMMKVKKLENEEPVLFLERGIYRKGYNFRTEMLRHLMTKSDSMTSKPKVMDEIRGKPKEGDPLVIGTGAYTENEYVESVFGLRRSRNVRHHGRIVTMKDLAPKPPEPEDEKKKDQPMPAIGIGTSNKTMSAYLAELRMKGVRVVVDIRANPQSQWFPHFNRKAMEESLRRAGIEYIWLGETLGNPKDSKGERTLEGFKRYMRTKAYEKGIAQLIEIIQSHDGKVAVTCSEGKEEDCHRRFVLEDLKKRVMNV